MLEPKQVQKERVMTQVTIEKVDGEKNTTSSIFDEIKTLSETIRQRAFEIFERRGGGHGFAVEDWLNAERDLIRIPESELVEHEGKFEVRVSAPGFNPGDVQVTALPDALIIKASSTHKHDKNEGSVRFCEFGQKTLFRRFDLPEPINLDKVTANLDKGVLHLSAPKAKQEAVQKQHAAA